MSRQVVGDVMRRHFITAAPGEDLRSVHQTMRLARLRHLLIAEGGRRLVGIVSYRDLVEILLGTERPAPSRKGNGRGRAHAGTPVAAAMHEVLAATTPETPLEAAARSLLRYHYGCLPVVETADDDAQGPVLTGLVTESDLLRAAYGPPR